MSQKWCCVLIASYSHGMWSDLAHDWCCSFWSLTKVCLASLLQQYSFFSLILWTFCRQVLSKYLTHWISSYSFIYVLVYLSMDSWFHFNSMLKLTQLVGAPSSWFLHLLYIFLHILRTSLFSGTATCPWFISFFCLFVLKQEGMSFTSLFTKM